MVMIGILNTEIFAAKNDRQGLDTQWLYRLHEVKNKLDRSNTSQAQSQTGTYVRGDYEISVLILYGKKCYHFIHKNEDKLQGKIRHRQNFTQKWYKCIIYTHHRSDRPIWSMQIIHIDLLGNIYICTYIYSSIITYLCNMCIYGHLCAYVFLHACM